MKVRVENNFGNNINNNSIVYPLPGETIVVNVNGEDTAVEATGEEVIFSVEAEDSQRQAEDWCLRNNYEIVGGVNRAMCHQ